MKRQQSEFCGLVDVFGGDYLAGGRLFAPQTGAGKDR